MRVTGLDHVSITTGDIDRSLEFYSGLLELPVMNRGEIDQSTIETITGKGDVRVRFADVDLGSGQVLELLEYVGASASQPRVDRPGGGHIALRVDDVEAVHRRLIDAGVDTAGKIAELDEPGHWFGAKAAYVVDPDGVTVELIQPQGAQADA